MIVLEGTGCSIYNYNRDEFKKDILVDLWKLMEEDGDSDKALWPFEKHDLVQFIQYLSDTHNVLFVVYNKECTDYVGFTWFNEIVPNFKAHTALYIRKKYRKTLTDEASTLSMDFMFNHFSLTELWSHTPWENAHKLALRLGFTEIATLPNYVRLKGVLHNFYISRLKRK